MPVGGVSAKIRKPDPDTFVVDPGAKVVGIPLAGVATTGLTTLVAAGRNGAGAITLTGATVGQRVLFVIGAPTAGGTLASPNSSFESVITVADQIQQSAATNLSANTYIFVLAPAAATE